MTNASSNSMQTDSNTLLSINSTARSAREIPLQRIAPNQQISENSVDVNRFLTYPIVHSEQSFAANTTIEATKSKFC